jgi:hypothetical protein
MRLQFKNNLDYQLKVVSAVADILEEQLHSSDVIKISVEVV